MYCANNVVRNDFQYYKHQLHQLALALGITWGPHECEPLEEYRADLFSEQTILCHYLPTLAQETFSFLMQQGIPTPLAYAEIFLELKLIGNALTQMDNFYL
jgi:ketol-acid reductoisomerase